MAEQLPPGTRYRVGEVPPELVWHMSARRNGKEHAMREAIAQEVAAGHHVHSWSHDGEVCESATPGCPVAEGVDPALPLQGMS